MKLDHSLLEAGAGVCALLHDDAGQDGAVPAVAALVGRHGHDIITAPVIVTCLCGLQTRLQAPSPETAIRSPTTVHCPARGDDATS